MGTVTLKGNPIDVAGTFRQKGQRAPGFQLVAKDLKAKSLKRASQSERGKYYP